MTTTRQHLQRNIQMTRNFLAVVYRHEVVIIRMEDSCASSIHSNAIPVERMPGKRKVGLGVKNWKYSNRRGDDRRCEYGCRQGLKNPKRKRSAEAVSDQQCSVINRRPMWIE